MSLPRRLSAPAPRAGAAALRGHQGPHAVPLDLVGEGVVVARQAAGLGEHRPQVLGYGLAPGVLGRVHAVDHPVLPVRLEQGVPALEAFPVEGEDHLVVAELLGLVGPAVPDLHVPRAVLAGRDVALEVEVLERVVLDVHREVVALGVRRDALGHRPRHQRSVPLEA